jgi:hypothetical protein
MVLKRVPFRFRASAEMHDGLAWVLGPSTHGLPQLQAERLATARRMSDPTAKRPVAMGLWWDFADQRPESYCWPLGILAIMAHQEAAKGHEGR